MVIAAVDATARGVRLVLALFAPLGRIVIVEPSLVYRTMLPFLLRTSLRQHHTGPTVPL